MMDREYTGMDTACAVCVKRMSGDVAAEPELAQASDEIHRLRKTLDGARTSLADFIERMLLGPQPPCDTAEVARGARAFNGGVTGQLRQAIESANDLADQVDRLTSRLRQIG